MPMTSTSQYDMTVHFYEATINLNKARHLYVFTYL